MENMHNMAERYGRLWAIVIALVIATLAATLLYNMHTEYEKLLIRQERASTRMELETVSVGLNNALNSRFSLLLGLKAFAEAAIKQGNAELEFSRSFEAFAAGLYGSAAGIRNFIIAPGGVNKYVFPLDRNRKALGHNLLTDTRPQVRKDVQRTIENGRMALSGPYELRQGGLGIVCRIAVYEDGKFWGLVSMVLDVPPVLSEAGIPEYSRKKLLAIKDASGKLFYGEGKVYGESPETQRIALPEGYWTLAVAPNDGWGGESRLSLLVFDALAWIVVILIAVSSSLLFFRHSRLRRAVKSRTAELYEANLKLVEENKRRVQSEGELCRSEFRFRSFFESSPFSLWEENMSGLVPIFERLQAKGIDDFEFYFRESRSDLQECLAAIKVIDVNPASVLLFKAERKEDLLQGIADLFCDTSWDLFALEVAALASGKQHFHGEGKVLDLTGVEMDVLLYAEVIPGNEGPLDKILITIVDITEKRKLEEIMVQTEKMMSVGGLAAGMAHEINNPLAGILQGVQNVIRRLSPDLKANVAAAESEGISFAGLRGYLERRDIPRELESIRIAGERAAQVVRNMLDFSRKSVSAFSTCDINSLLNTALEIASSDYDLKKNYDFKSIKIVREFDPDASNSRCISSEMEQVFLNLFKNAAHAMEKRGGEGEAVLTLRTRKERRKVVVEVEDNGIGMPDKIRKRIFDPFFTTKPPGAGTGLGLSVSYFIITKNHGGSFTVESQPGQGTCFRITIPQ
ncbi:ATP-binding protein [Maridesulfovibrio sp. FT414]|uniref:ATP-binding protein n=1 Tax=Maridesulfovibrio sp. FT414 TaxID=2979469 RepID=UPI003D804938